MYNRGLIAAMEAEQELKAEEPLLEGTPAGTPEGIDTVESDLLEATDMQAEVTAELDQVDAGLSDSEGLAKIADILEETASTGGMDESMARVVEVAVESYYKRLGISNRKTMPAMESFSKDTSRVAATRVAIEGVMDTIKTVWKAIVDAVMRMSAVIKNFFAKLFDVNKRLGDRAGKLKERVSAMGTAKPKEETVTGGFVSTLAKGNKLDQAGVIKTLGNMTAAAESNPALCVYGAEMLVKFDQLAEQVAFVDKFEQVEFPLFSVANVNAVGEAEGFKKHPVEGISYHRSVELPGNMAVIIVAATKKLKGTEGIDALASSKVFVGSFDPKAKKAAVESAPTLNKAGMEAIVTEVAAASAAVEKGKESVQIIEKARAAFLAELKKFASEGAKGDKDSAARLNKLKNAATNMNRLTVEMVSSVNKIVVNISKAALDYVEKSAAQYSMPKEDAKDAKAA